MNSRQRRRLKRIMPKFEAFVRSLPHFGNNNATPAQEAEAMRVMEASPEFHKLLMHLPELKKRILRATRKIVNANK